jgi:hypothetical protein
MPAKKSNKAKKTHQLSAAKTLNSVKPLSAPKFHHAEHPNSEIPRG